MNRSIVMGQYLPGNSALHRLNPRFKVLMLLLILFLLFTLKTYGGLGALFIISLLLLAVSGVPFHYLLRGLRPILYIILFAMVIYLFFTKGGVVLLKIGFITVESDGLREGFFVITRLITLVFFSLLLTLTTTPLSLTYGMGYFLKPLRLFGLPTDEITMIMAIALRFIPTLIEESQRLMRAQVARGADFETGTVFRKAKSMVPLIVPLFVSAFRRADELATAMEARGYRIGVLRTRMREDKLSYSDWIALGMIILLLVIALIMGL